ncbi:MULTISPECIES: LacI family DNA-binding transcriptional regulator [unclassified Streptomyces]|uniref:LacI family DNA-binding transcriptional regulator n=1 Tax=unclassified Streptomyces TaxID=2593676 RepID=UPI002033D797|nr:LacI family DNA-binding transcriptional regulator [Streptomyces sp. RKAG290]MCM2416187.1 LacI family transcriptional regulator [Streptomyces sp. RKAG290]
MKADTLVGRTASPSGSGRKTTIRDVAQRAGVSPSAVTLAMHGKPGVSSTTKERILQAARDLGWSPNQAAQSLKGQALHSVGLAIARPARMLGLEPFYMEFISGIESVLTQHSCSLLLRLVEPDEEIEVHRDWWQGNRASGSILVDLRVDDPRIAALSAISLPAVAVGHPSLAGPFTAVWTDDAAAVVEAVRYLAALGHRTIGRVSGPAELGHSMIRTKAFTDTAQELGLQARTVVADFSADQGSRACRTLLLSAERPTAIIFDNDLMAVTALGVAAEFGLSVPHDLSLLAWDDSQLCQLTRPTLSAMQHDVFSFGADVTETLFDVMLGREASSHAAQVPRLVPRASTAPPPRS